MRCRIRKRLGYHGLWYRQCRFWGEREWYNKYHCSHSFLYLFWSGLCYPLECSLLGDIIPSQNRGYTVTRLCPYCINYLCVNCLNVLSVWPFISQGSSLLSTPLGPLTPLDALISSSTTSDSAYTSTSDSNSDSESVAMASAALSFAAFGSIPS